LIGIADGDQFHAHIPLKECLKRNIAARLPVTLICEVIDVNQRLPGRVCFLYDLAGGIPPVDPVLHDHCQFLIDDVEIGIKMHLGLILP
jgi:hypothetical protein